MEIIVNVLQILCQIKCVHSFLVSTNETEEEPLDACTKWERCSVHKHPRVIGWLRALPGCPCMYPRYLYISDRSLIYDPVHKRDFRWHRMSNRLEKLHVYKPYARFCIRQALTSHSPAVQQCCYDDDLLLITRGSGAGTPHLVSRDVEMSAHYKVDLLPWRLCRGDWTRYHNIRPPNNALNCSQNPDDLQFALQRKKATEYWSLQQTRYGIMCAEWHIFPEGSISLIVFVIYILPAVSKFCPDLSL